jgi:hypothetical protein
MRDLRGVEPPGAEAARRRAWAVTAEAFAGRETRRRPRRVLVAALAGVLGIVGGVALTPPGEAVADWLRAIVEPAPAPQRPAPRAAAALPGPGRVLLVGDRALRIGGGPSLGAWSGATWSPHGRYVAAWRGRTLSALGRDGRRAWSIAAPAPVRAARWSPEGFHVAYLTGAQLRVVAGNGARDRLWRTPVRPVAPAFRPTARRTLAWVRPDGRIPVADVFTGRLRARSGPRLGEGAQALAWSGDGRRLAVLARGHVRIWDVGRGTVRTIALAGRATSLAAAPRGSRFAVVTRDARRGVSAVVLLGGRGGGTVARVHGRLRDVAFSPDGRRVVTSWPAERRWLLVSVRGRALESVPAAGRRADRIAGWCCG